MIEAVTFCRHIAYGSSTHIKTVEIGTNQVDLTLKILIYKLVKMSIFMCGKQLLDTLTQTVRYRFIGFKLYDGICMSHTVSSQWVSSVDQ